VNRSSDLFERSRRLFPKGVSSPVRFFEPHPFFTRRASGSKIVTEDGQEFIDYCMAYGPLIFGHAPSFVGSAVGRQLKCGTVYGTPSCHEVRLAEEVKRAYSSISLIRFVNSGAEAAANAVRLARAYTKRDVVMKIDGGYHGAVDQLMINGTGMTRKAFSAGVPNSTSRNTKTIAFNDLGSLSEIGEDVACVIVEPVMGNIGMVKPKDGYLRELRRACDDAGAVLIFDEVITGFRVAKGGAQSLYGVSPDLTTFGKILGGGFPIGAFGGREEIMRMVAPEGSVFNAGTFNGNPISMAAGAAVIERLNDGVYRTLRESTDTLCEGISDALDGAGIDFFMSKLESMFTVFLTGGTVTDYSSARSADAGKFMRLHSGLMERGVYLPPSQFECCFMSTAHSKEDLEKTTEAFVGAALDVKRGAMGS